MTGDSTVSINPASLGRRTKRGARSLSFKKATFSVIVGKPADAAHPPGMNGMIVVVEVNKAIPPIFLAGAIAGAWMLHFVARRPAETASVEVTPNF